MSGTSRASFARQALRRCILLCCGVCVVLSLAPCADFDLDGSFDSFATEGFLMNTTVPRLALPGALLRRSKSDRVRPAEPFSAPIPHPPTL